MMVEAIPSISTISTSVTDQDRVAVMKESGQFTLDFFQVAFAPSSGRSTLHDCEN